MVNKNNTEIIYRQLSILITQDGFLFYIHHQKNDLSKDLVNVKLENIVSPKSLKLFQKHLKNFKHLYNFESIKVAFADANYTLIPKYYYNEANKADYLKYNVQLLEEDQITTDFIEAIDVYQVYIPLMNYHNAILEEVKEFEYQHFTNTLINLSKPKTFDTKQRLNVFIRNHCIDIIAFENQSFKLCNSFQYESDYDLVYYVLFAVEELKFDQKNMYLQVFHDQDETEWLDIVKRYVLNVKSEKRNLAAFVV